MRSGFSIPPNAGISIPPRLGPANAPRAPPSSPPDAPLPSPPKPAGSSTPPAALLKPTALDTIIQSATVEILRSYDITVAPRARTEVIGHIPDSDVVGIIAFEGPHIGGNLTLAVPVSVCPLAMPRRARNTTHAEWIYEIT